MLQRVKIIYPGGKAPNTIQARSFKLSGVKLITLGKGKKVAEEPAFPPFSEATKAKNEGGASRALSLRKRIPARVGADSEVGVLAR